MDRRKCKLCSRSFSNGKALGGHMRSHLATLHIPPKTQQNELGHRLGDLTESASSLCSSRDEQDREIEQKGLIYGLRENPKKSFKFVGPEFLDAGSAVVQDRESETESTRNPTRRRSKRTRRMGDSENLELKKPKLIEPDSTELIPELEPVSSVSVSSPEEELALCLIMLSRDSWSSDDSDESTPSQTGRKYQCETCKRVFGSFQALGGHRTSHDNNKKIKNRFEDHEDESEPSKKVFECPFCDKVFGSGQALGGHKRSHLLGSSPKMAISVITQSPKVGGCLIDLNLPAPFEDEDLSQLEVSAAFDSEFVNPIRC